MFCFDPTSLLQVDIDTDRAMVGTLFVGPDKGLVYAPHRSRRCEDVVDPPSDVPLARAAPLPPPRVLVRRLGMQGAKGIHPARVDPAVELSVINGGYIRLSADCPHPPISFEKRAIWACEARFLITDRDLRVGRSHPGAPVTPPFAD